MKITRKQSNPTKLIEILPGETFKLLNANRIFIKTMSIPNSNANAISLDDGQAFSITSDSIVTKVEGEFVEK